MVVLAGEWVNANLLFSAAFLVAVGGVIGLGWYVVRAARLNRALEDQDPAEEPLGHTPGTHDDVHGSRAHHPEKAS